MVYFSPCAVFGWCYILLWSFPCGVKVGSLFDCVLAVKTCCCPGPFEEIEVPSLGLVVSGVDADVIAAKEFYKFTMK